MLVIIIITITVTLHMNTLGVRLFPNIKLHLHLLYLKMALTAKKKIIN